jgi:rubredoxin
MAVQQTCRNCGLIYDIEETNLVRPNPGETSFYRYCNPCFSIMKQNRQVMPDWVKRDGHMVLMFEGNPMNPGRNMVARKTQLWMKGS